MRKHGWQLPYHPLQVVAVAVFLALGFAFYVFFAPFVGKKLFQYIVMGIYTPLIVCVFGLYIWCAAADPADSGVFKSKKYLKIPDNKKHVRLKESKLGGDSTTSINNANAAAIGDNPIDRSPKGAELQEENHKKNTSDRERSCFLSALALLPCALVFNCCEPHDHSSELQMSEEGMFYCSLCEVEVFRYSKHCRVCDKCVDRFDHHCRWLNNCIGKRNYRKFFALMISALILLTLQWATGISVLICCFIERKRFSTNVASKLGSSFSVVPYVIVVAVCTILAMIATLPLSQLFFFHILLIKKGISTYDYIIAMREQEQQGGGTGGGQQSPQMSQASSLTGLSSASSFNAFNRGAWCTPPRLFLEDQFDVIPPETGSVSSLGKKSVLEEPTKKKNPAAVKISPWAVARMNAETVAKYAAEARSKSKIYQPVSRREGPYRPELDVASSGRRMIPRPEIPSKRRSSKRIRLPSDLSPLEPAPIMAIPGASTSTGLGPLRPEARIAFRSQASSSPDSSLGSPDQHVFRVSSSGTEEASRLAGLSGSQKGNMPLSRSTSDGYDASGGEDSDRVSSSRIIQRPVNWSNLLFGYDHDDRLKASSSSTSMRRI